MLRSVTLVVVVVVAGCGPPPLPDPCVDPVESASPTLAIAPGNATIEYGDEGLPRGLFVRRFDSDGALSWTVPVAKTMAYDRERFVVAGDTAYVFEDDGPTEFVTGVRDGQLAFHGTSPFDCDVESIEPHVDHVRVYGSSRQFDRMCTYRITSTGSFEDLVGFDADTAYAAYSDGGAGYLVSAKEGIVHYDAAGARLWQHPGTFLGELVVAGGAVWAFRWDGRSATLVRIGADGQGEAAIVGFAVDSADSGNAYLKIFTQAMPDGVIAAVEHDYSYQHELVRANGAGLVWSHPLDLLAGAPLGGVSLGSNVLVVRGKSLVAYDLDGNARWTAATAPLDAVVGSDDRVRVADDKPLDACRAVLRVATLDENGNAQSTWSAR